MILEEGEVITLDTNNKDYVILKRINYNNEYYYYMFTVDKPVEMALVKIENADAEEPIIVTITDQKEIEEVMKATAKEIK